jgi:hypothetical protein
MKPGLAIQSHPANFSIFANLIDYRVSSWVLHLTQGVQYE